LTSSFSCFSFFFLSVFFFPRMSTRIPILGIWFSDFESRLQGHPFKLFFLLSAFRFFWFPTSFLHEEKNRNKKRKKNWKRKIFRWRNRTIRPIESQQTQWTGTLQSYSAYANFYVFCVCVCVLVGRRRCGAWKCQVWLTAGPAPFPFSRVSTETLKTTLSAPPDGLLLLLKGRTGGGYTV
jgi:hypothetical protein